MKHKRSSVILVFNNKKELLLQKRSSLEETYPFHWDFSAAGGIESGESHKIAAQRELKEELGIKAKLKYLGEEKYQDKKSTDQLYVYTTVHNGPFNHDPKEVEEVRFFKFESIKAMLKSGAKFHPEFPFLWEKDLIKKR